MIGTLRPTSAQRAALTVIQIAAAAIVIAALPYPLFELDRYTIPKELILETAALMAGLLCLASARRLSVMVVDAPIAGYLVLSTLSTILAANGWLAFRALGVSLAGATLFWCGRTLTRAGLRRPLLAALAFAIVLGAVTALAQAYGLIDSSLASLSRAPGGTFGNRNFMAHLVALGLPLLLFLALEARDRVRFSLGAAGVALSAAALVLSRSRAAWLAAAIGGVFLVVEGLWIGGLWADTRLRRRVLQLTGVAVAGLVLALILPNRLNWRSESPYLDSLTGVTNYKEGSGRGRLIQYGNTIDMAVHHPVLGVGPGNWPVFYPRFMSAGDPSYDADDIIPTNPWPSGDWMAVASERGFLALILLALVGVSTALGAWTRLRHGSASQPALTDLTIVATMIALAVVGSFDAVLLLPVPTFFAAVIVGALAASARPIREVTLTSTSRRWALAVAAVAGLLFVGRGAAQTVAMSLYDTGKLRTMELAARVDPGSYRIHMLLGGIWLRAGKCDRARPHAQAAQELFPNHPAPTRILRSCGVRKLRP
ncbi:MAG: O-antigen ligase family protein [Gemmatimonadales bacterium]